MTSIAAATGQELKIFKFVDPFGFKIQLLTILSTLSRLGALENELTRTAFCPASLPLTEVTLYDKNTSGALREKNVITSH